MGHKNKLILGLATLMMASLSLAGCGGTSNTSGGTSDASSTTSITPTKTVEVTFWHTFGQTIQEKLNDLATKFHDLVLENEHVEVNISCVGQGGDYATLLSKIQNGYSSGITPTIAVAYPDHVAEYLNYKNFVVNMDTYINDEKYTFGTDKYLGDTISGTDDFVSSFFKEGQNYIVDGTYSLPFLKSTELMYYNKNLVETVLINDFRDESVPISKYMNNLTWDEFMKLCEAVRYDIDNNGGETYGTKLKKPVYYDSDSNLFISQCVQSNTPFLGYDKANNKGTCLFDNDQAKSLVKSLKASYDKGYFFTKGSNGGDYGSDSFKSGEVLFSIGSSGGTAYQDPKGQFEVGICPVPSINGNKTFVSQGPTLTLLNNISETDEQNADNALYGFKFLKYLTNVKNNISMCFASSGYFPVRTSCYENDDYVDFLNQDSLVSKSTNVVINSVNGAYFYTPVFKGSAYARTAVGGLLTQSLLSKNIDADIDNLFAEAKNNTLIAMA